MIETVNTFAAFSLADAAREDERRRAGKHFFCALDAKRPLLERSNSLEYFGFEFTGEHNSKEGWGVYASDCLWVTLQDGGPLIVEPRSNELVGKESLNV